MILSLFFFLTWNLISIATTPEEATVQSLKSDSDRWEVVISTESGRLSERGAEQVKRDLLDYFELAGYPSLRAGGQSAIYSLLILAFSTLGYFRERHLEKAKAVTQQG